MLKNIKSGKPIIAIAIAVIIISAIFCAVGQSRMDAAKAEYGYAFNETYYYWPGEQMRDHSQAGIALGVCLLVWGCVLEYQRKKDVHSKEPIKDLLKEDK